MPTINAQYGQGNRPWYDGLRKAQTIVEQFTTEFEMWFDAADSDTWDQDGGGGIIEWRDKSPKERTLDGTSNIVINNTFNGNPVFDVSNDNSFNQRDIFDINAETLIVVYVGRDRTGVTSSSHFYDFRKGGSQSASTLALRDGNIFVRQEDNNDATLSITPLGSDLEVITIRVSQSTEFAGRRLLRTYNGTNLSDEVDNFGDITIPFEFGRLSLGSSPAGSFGNNCSVGEFLFFNADVSDEDLMEVIQFTEQKWGIS